MNQLERARVRNLLAKRGVVAVGVGHKNGSGPESIVCSVIEKKAKASLMASDLVPSQIDGVDTDVVETGLIRAPRDLRPFSFTDRRRPVPQGISIGHYEITAGTAGPLVKVGEEYFILTNNHVAANSNNGIPGDPILQPGAYDGGQLGPDTWSRLEAFIPIEFDGAGAPPGLPDECNIGDLFGRIVNKALWFAESRSRVRVERVLANPNYIDAALVGPLALDSDVVHQLLGNPDSKIHGVNTAALGTELRKSGRTTEYTVDYVRQVQVTVRVQYDAGRTATYEDQLMAGPMSQGGDSGSAVLNGKNELVALLFAGSDTTTIVSPIQYALDYWGAEVVTA